MIAVIATVAVLSLADPPRRPPDVPARQSQTARDRWTGTDKVKHFFMSALIQSAAFSVARTAGAKRSSAQWAAGVTSAAFGVGKEILDRRTGKPFSVKDLAWDAAGALAAAALLNGTR